MICRGERLDFESKLESIYSGVIKYVLKIIQLLRIVFRIMTSSLKIYCSCQTVKYSAKVVPKPFITRLNSYVDIDNELVRLDTNTLSAGMPTLDSFYTLFGS